MGLRFVADLPEAEIARIGGPAADALADPASRPVTLTTHREGDAVFNYLVGGGTCSRGVPEVCTTTAIGGFDDAVFVIRVDSRSMSADARLVLQHLRWLTASEWQAAVDERLRLAPPVDTPGRMPSGPILDNEQARSALSPLYGFPS